MQVFELPEADPPPRLVTFSPDGRLLAVWVGGRVRVIDSVAGAVRLLWDVPDSGRAEGSGLAFTADGRRVLARHVAPTGPVILAHDAEVGTVLGTFPLHALNDGFVPAPDNQAMLVALHPTPDGTTAEFVRWNPLTDERSEPFAAHRNVIRQLAVSTNGRWLGGTFGNELRVWDLGGTNPPTRATYRQHFGPDFVMCLALSADGTFAAAGELNGPIRLIEVRTRETHIVSARPRDRERDIAFHPSLPLLAFGAANEEIVFYDASARAELKRFAWGIGNVSAVAFSADGLRCAAAGVGKAIVWDVDV